jgi:hypothetical protein
MSIVPANVNTADRNHVRRPTLPVLLQHTTALPALGVRQQARVLLLHHYRLRGPDYGGYRAADSEIYGAGTEAQDPYDLSQYVCLRLAEKLKRCDLEI